MIHASCQGAYAGIIWDPKSHSAVIMEEKGKIMALEICSRIVECVVECSRIPADIQILSTICFPFIVLMLWLATSKVPFWEDE